MIGSARLGGAEGQLVKLAVELAMRGDTVMVLFTAAGGSLTAQLDSAGVPWHVLRSLRPPTSTLRNLFAIFVLAWRLLLFRPNIVYSWLAGTIWFALPVAAVVTRAKRVAAFRGEVFEADLRWMQRPFRFAIRHAHAVTVNAPSLTAEAVRWGADSTKIHLIPNGVALPSAFCVPDKQPPTAVVVANFRWYKGHDVLLQAAALLENPVKIRLCGEGDSRDEFEMQAKELGLQDVLCLVDEPADVPAELQAAQFAIHPSRTEGLSNAILEQISFGMPVVATDVGGARLLVEDGESGFVVPAGDAEALAAAIDKLSHDPGLRSEMGLKARDKSTEFSWASCGRLNDEVFTLIENKR